MARHLKKQKIIEDYIRLKIMKIAIIIKRMMKIITIIIIVNTIIIFKISPNSMIVIRKTRTKIIRLKIIIISPNSMIVPLTDPSINLCWKKGSKARPKEPNIGI